MNMKEENLSRHDMIFLIAANIMTMDTIMADAALNRAAMIYDRLDDELSTIESKSLLK